VEGRGEEKVFYKILYRIFCRCRRGKNVGGGRGVQLCGFNLCRRLDLVHEGKVFMVGGGSGTGKGGKATPAGGAREEGGSKLVEFKNAWGGGEKDSRRSGGRSRKSRKDVETRDNSAGQVGSAGYPATVQKGG